MNKKLVFTLLFSLLFVGFIPFVGAGDYDLILVSSYSGSTPADLKAVNPSTSALHSAHGSSFTVSTSVYLRSVVVSMAKTVDCDAVFRCKIINSTVLFAVSTNTISSDVLGTDFSVRTFSFNGTFLMESGVVYRVMIYVESGNQIDDDDIGYVYVGSSASDNQGWVYYQSAYHSPFNRLSYSLYGSLASGDPTPAVTQNVRGGDPFVSVPSYYMVLLVLFAVVAVLAGLYVTFEREQENKGVALLFVLVGLVLFVVLIVGYFVGF